MQNECQSICCDIDARRRWQRQVGERPSVSHFRPLSHVRFGGRHAQLRFPKRATRSLRQPIRSSLMTMARFGFPVFVAARGSFLTLRCTSVSLRCGAPTTRSRGLSCSCRSCPASPTSIDHRQHQSDTRRSQLSAQAAAVCNKSDQPFGFQT